jgi:hypothetical protein
MRRVWLDGVGHRFAYGSARAPKSERSEQSFRGAGRWRERERAANVAEGRWLMEHETKKW